ncbi:MAG: hypothetical protein M3N16_08855 [Actinomycetota bacterium]|nr:hypothetical protein [Actinomycetota bacterium]
MQSELLIRTSTAGAGPVRALGHRRRPKPTLRCERGAGIDPIVGLGTLDQVATRRFRRADLDPVETTAAGW